MYIKSKLVLVAVIMIISLSFIGCPEDDESESEPSYEKAPAYGTFSDTLSARAVGNGGWVYVDVRFEEGMIEEVKIDHKETSGGSYRAAEFINDMKIRIPKANSFQPVVDAVTNATTTKRALIEAGEQIIAEALSK